LRESVGAAVGITQELGDPSLRLGKVVREVVVRRTRLPIMAAGRGDETDQSTSEPRDRLWSAPWDKSMITALM